MTVLEVIRPILITDGGNLTVVRLSEEEATVEIELVGACGTCPVSSDTVHGGIERILKDRVDAAIRVVVVNDTWEAKS